MRTSRILSSLLGGVTLCVLLEACSSTSTDVVIHPFGMECRLVEQSASSSSLGTVGAGCICFLSATPNNVVCDAETVAGTCKKTAEWPQPGGSYYSTNTYSASSPGCQCLTAPAKGAPTTARITCTGQDQLGKIGKDDSCYCSKLSPPTSSSSSSTTKEEPCAIAAGQTGICCATADRCNCSTYSFDQTCDAGETKVASCTGAIFPKDPAPIPPAPTFSVGGYSSSYSTVETDSCVTTPFDRSQIR
jgi:hypothetical protein